MSARLQVAVDLTRSEAEALEEVLQGLCVGNAARAAAKTLAAIGAARTEADAAAAALATRTSPCRACGREVVHSARGLRLPAKHNCSHGRDCNGSHPNYSMHVSARCPKCSIARSALAENFARGPDTMPEPMKP